MKVNIKRNELALKRSDYKFTWKDPKGKTHFETCDFRPNGERLSLTKPELEEAAEADKRKHFGWKVFPRHSFTVELIESYRIEGEPNPRNRFIWSKTFNPLPLTSYGTTEQPVATIKRRFEFWEVLERQLVRHKVADDNADRIREQVAEVVPVVTSNEFRTMQSHLEKKEKNRNY
ncbi:MAG: hypothetical protein DMF63_00520 [Acidobacteria bacterium]|nr:MAG: hypothetical protein DMF63_00520 [Acidobacteriota bacterium]